MKLPINGLSLDTSHQVLQVKSATALLVLSSAITGGGFERTHVILNFHVDKGYARDDPAADMQSMARELDIAGPFVGMMTAADVMRPGIAFFEEGDWSAGAIVTAGLSNATGAGITPPSPGAPGTINTIILLDACLSQAAMVNAIITATEAKCGVLQSMGIRTAQGEPATGTSTDAIVVAATGRGAVLPYAGPATLIGWLIARAVRQALYEGLSGK